jgi:hypothetical protein
MAHPKGRKPPAGAWRYQEGGQATLLWPDQLALKPGHYRFGLHGVGELHRRLQLMPATMTFKGSKVIT